MIVLFGSGRKGQPYCGRFRPRTAQSGMNCNEVLVDGSQVGSDDGRVLLPPRRPTSRVRPKHGPSSPVRKPEDLPCNGREATSPVVPLGAVAARYRTRFHVYREGLWDRGGRGVLTEAVTVLLRNRLRNPRLERSHDAWPPTGRLTTSD
jgi:hypothetical protein